MLVASRKFVSSFQTPASIPHAMKFFQCQDQLISSIRALEYFPFMLATQLHQFYQTWSLFLVQPVNLQLDPSFSNIYVISWRFRLFFLEFEAQMCTGSFVA
jgi:hypothetical protein